MGLSKKKTSLSAKAKIRSKSLHVTKAPSSKISATESLETQLLNRAQSKLQKSLTKSLEFAEKIKRTTSSNAHNNADKSVTVNDKSILSTSNENYKNFDEISKSAIRRRKRKLRDNLKPKMSDLLETLDTVNNVNSAVAEVTGTTGGSKPVYIPSKSKAHVPNPHKNRNVKSLIETTEKKIFSGVLTSSEFKSNPFSALKDKIAKNLNNFQ